MVGHVFSACWEDGDMVVWVLFILLIVGATFVFKFMKTVMWLLLYFLFYEPSITLISVYGVYIPSLLGGFLS